MNTLRPFGVTLRPKPGCPASQYTMSDFGVGSVSIALLLSRMRGMEGGTCREALPSLRIGSTANEMTGLNVIFRPHSRKKNQRVMNHQLSTSISGKHHPENYGRGSRPSLLGRYQVNFTVTGPTIRRPPLRHPRAWRLL